MKIFVSGSIARDLIMDFPGKFVEHIDPEKIHVLNLSFAVQNLKFSRGGTAANIAYNLALLGEEPEIIGNIGSDQKDFLAYFRNHGIGVSYLKICANHLTSGAYIITDRDDNQIAGFHVGAMSEPVRLPKVKAGDWAIIAPEQPANMMKLVRHYQKHRVNYIFDPGQTITGLSKSQLMNGIKGAKVLIGNDYEIGMIFSRLSLRGPRREVGGRSGFLKEYERLLRFLQNNIVVIRTLGPRGSEIYCGRKKNKIGIAKPVRVVDPTGAGDAYRTGFLKGLILGYNLRTCGELGATVASFAVEKYGTQKHRFTFKNVVKRHNKNFINKLSLRGSAAGGDEAIFR